MKDVMITFGELKEIGEELYPRFAEFEDKLKHNIDKELTRCFGENWINDITKNVTGNELIPADFTVFDIPNDAEVLGIINSLKVIDEVNRAKGEKDKFSLGCWIKIIENFYNIELALLVNPQGLTYPYITNIFQTFKHIYPKSKTIKIDNRIAHFAAGHNIVIIDYEILENPTNEEVSQKGLEFFKKWGSSGGEKYGNKTVINHIFDTNSIVFEQIRRDLQQIQSLRNDFCHFKFDILKLEEATNLLDKYIKILK